jgi:predicted metal-binding membrane protein
MSALPDPERGAWPARGRMLGLLALLVALCWACLVFRALRLSSVLPASLPGLLPPPYRAPDLLRVLATWSATLAAIVLPAASPALLLFADLDRLQQGQQAAPAGTPGFVAGYLALWGGFGLGATGVQWALHAHGALDAQQAIANPAAGGLLLVLAGLYQWTPLKHACLRQCRAPLALLLADWRSAQAGPPGQAAQGAQQAQIGYRQALRIGYRYGLQCLGCCALLLLLPLAAGGASLGALLALAALVLAEKLLPGGAFTACLGGLVLVAWGTLLLFPQA